VSLSFWPQPDDNRLDVEEAAEVGELGLEVAVEEELAGAGERWDIASAGELWP